MGIRRALIVGCGGSGGKTLAYMMDQLASDLAEAGIYQMPPGWQFVHVDVPLSAESGPPNMANVPGQGGRYVSTGVSSDSYHDLDSVVAGRLAAASGGAQLHTIASWAPADPRHVMVNIGNGAGQYRAIGRMLTLHSAAHLLQTFDSIWKELFLPSTDQAMRSLSLLGPYDAQQPPLVFVVSSMAGGAGASMALDVCRLLSGVQGLPTANIGVFMVSPDIFAALPQSQRPGVYPNALAMMGEIVAAQVGSSAVCDQDVLSGLGINGISTPTPFARVFPVGLYAGKQHARFGDGSANDVYRGLGRGLAALLKSAAAVEPYVAYDLTNTGGLTPNRADFGWGCEPDQLAWGSFGFASMSMGRDRYAEYSAQRFARRAVDRLLDGHLDPGSPASGAEQLRQRVSDNWDRECRALRMWCGPAQGSFADWLVTEQWPQAALLGAIRGPLEADLQASIDSPDGQEARAWAGVAAARLHDHRQIWDNRVYELAYRWAFGWHRQLLDATCNLLRWAMANWGLPYANALLDRVRSHVQDVVIPAAAQLRDQPGEPIAVLGADLERQLAGLRGRISNGRQIQEQLANRIVGAMAQHTYARACGFVADLLGAYVADVLNPFETSISAATTLLDTARRQAPQVGALAVVQSNQYGDWPLDDAPAPERFDEANNEVLLTSSRDFKPQFEADVIGSVPGDLSYRDAREAAVTRIIAGEWEMPKGGRPPGGLLGLEQDWRPQILGMDPETRQPLSAQRSVLAVRVDPAQVLQRARAFVDRADMSFSRFCTVSLRDFVLANDVPPAMKQQVSMERGALVIDKFRSTLALALPLAGVSPQLVQALYGQSVHYRYKFSEVPFAGLGGLQDQLLAVTDPIADPNLDASVQINLQSALSTGDRVRRVDVFGSYPNYVPICFDSILQPAVKQWDESSPAAKADFWKWRRSRPLAGSLPLGRAALQAMVTAWFLGQIIGQLRFPRPPYTGAVAPAEVWDPQQQRWVSFPDPMLTPVERFRHLLDWLPCVLESSLLAIGRTYQNPVLESLRPYRLLREMVDDSPNMPVGPVQTPAGQIRLAEWLRTGQTASGFPSMAPGADTASTITERKQAAEALLARSEQIIQKYFVPGSAADQTDVPYAQIKDRAVAAKAPLLRDLTDEVLTAMRVLRQQLDAAERLAATGSAGIPAAGADPSSLVPEIPEDTM